MRAHQRHIVYEQIRRRVAELARRDPRCKLFGASRHRYGFAPPLSELVVKAFENQNRVRLPEEYRDFLLLVGDGGAGPGYGIEALAKAAHVQLSEWRHGWLAQPFEHVTTMLAPDEDHFETLYDSTCGTLFVSELGCGGFYRMVVNGRLRGTIWEDWLADGHGMTPVSDSFLHWYGTWLAQAEEQLATSKE